MFLCFRVLPPLAGPCFRVFVFWRTPPKHTLGADGRAAMNLGDRLGSFVGCALSSCYKDSMGQFAPPDLNTILHVFDMNESDVESHLRRFHETLSFPITSVPSYCCGISKTLGVCNYFSRHSANAGGTAFRICF